MVNLISSFDEPILSMTPDYWQLKTDRGDGKVSYKLGSYKWGNAGAYPHGENVVPFGTEPVGILNPITDHIVLTDADVDTYEDQTKVVVKLNPSNLIVSQKYLVSELSIYILISQILIPPYPHEVGESIEIFNSRFPAEYFDPAILSSQFIKVIPIIGI